MIHDSSNPQAYFDSLEDDWRKTLVAFVTDKMASKVPEAQTFMQYKMLAFGQEGETDEASDSVFCMNAQSQYVSLYVGSVDRIDPDGAITEPFDCGKSCVRIKKSKRDKLDNIERLLDAAITDWKSRGH